MTLALPKEKIEKVHLRCQSLFSPPQTTALELTKTDRSDVFNCPGISSSSSVAEVFATTTNTTTKPGLFIPGRDNIKQPVKNVTSSVGGKSG